MSNDIAAALKYLIVSSLSADESSKVAASFLMSWYDSDTYGGFNMTDLWKVDSSMREAAIMMFGWIGRNRISAEELDLDLVFKSLGDRLVNHPV